MKRRLAKGLVFSLVAIAVLGTSCTRYERPNVRAEMLPVRELASLRTPPQDEGLQPGDRLSIRVGTAPELDATATVQPDGYVDLPGVGRVRVGGLPLERARRILQIRYRRIVREPELTVEVERATVPGVFVVGEVRQPGKVPYSNGLTLSRALILAGGPTPTAKLTAVRLFRQTGSSQVRRFDVDLKAIFDGEPGYGDPLLSPDDVVVVPPSTIARVEQFVDRYIDGLLPLATITAFAWVYRIIVRGY